MKMFRIYVNSLYNIPIFYSRRLTIKYVICELNSVIVESLISHFNTSVEACNGGLNGTTFPHKITI